MHSADNLQHLTSQGSIERSSQGAEDVYGVLDAEKLFTAVRQEEKEKRDRQNQIAMSDLKNHAINVR